MAGGDIVAFVVLILFLVIPFLFILPSLLELLLGLDFSKDEENESPPDNRSSR